MLRGSKTTDLKQLLTKIQKNDSRAWSELVESFSGYIFSIARRYGLDDDDSSDVMIETFQALFSSRNRIESGLVIPKWLAVTAARTSLRVARLKKLRPVIEEDLVLLIADEESSAEESAIEAERARVLRSAVESLGGRCTPLLLELYFQEGSNYESASQKLNIPLGALGPTRARCLAKLKLLLEESDYF